MRVCAGKKAHLVIESSLKDSRGEIFSSNYTHIHSVFCCAQFTYVNSRSISQFGFDLCFEILISFIYSDVFGRSRDVAVAPQVSGE